MTKAIIFDLDSCLSPADEPGQQLFAPAFDAITNANQGSHRPSVLQDAFVDMWRLPFDFVAEKYRFTPDMKAAGWEVLSRLEVTTPMSGYGDLAVLKELPVLKFVVTSGFRRLQDSKTPPCCFRHDFIYLRDAAQSSRGSAHGLVIRSRWRLSH